MSKRLRFIALCSEHLTGGRRYPYIWGRKGPLLFDCSGFVTYCLWKAGGPDWRQTHASSTLFDALPPTERPEPGDLCFYGPPDRITHVMVWIGDGCVAGACNGNSTIKTLEAAFARGARVMRKATKDYRGDFRGFRRLAPLDESDEPAKETT